MKKRHNYRIIIQVDHVGRNLAIEKLEDLIFKLKAENWPEESRTVVGRAPAPTFSIEMGPIAPSMEERLTRIEREFDFRLGGLSEDAA